ncbi:hypothetical protein [uncultured Rhodoblastus sp.]|uniref:hypothetical protein n=1 Tax=uncultured Rhodoblastus sp. TaxID=543037 RepID=UPI0025F35A5B|nr:hypothetical protein [uncultured Rhodoblastus sp.]
MPKGIPANPPKTKRPRNWRSGPQCLICNHPDRARLELLRAGGASFDSLSKKFEGLSRDQIWRHWTNHVPKERKAELLGGPGLSSEQLAEKANEKSIGLLDSFDHVRARLFKSFDAACDAGDRNGQSVIAGRLLETLREIGKLTGEIRQLAPGGVTINNNVAVMSNPAIVELQATVIRALAPFPEARAAVISALRRLEGHAAPPMIEVRKCEAIDVAAE